MKLKYWLIIILGVVATGFCLVYFAKLPKPDLSPIVINHKGKSEITFEPLKFNTTY